LLTSSITAGLNFINILRAAFTLADPECIKRQSLHQYLLALLGSMSAKAARRTLMKLTSGAAATKAPKRITLIGQLSEFPPRHEIPDQPNQLSLEVSETISKNFLK